MIIFPHYHYQFNFTNLAMLSLRQIMKFFIIFKIASSKSLVQKFQRGIALIFFIEIVDKELLKYKVENIRWGIHV